TVIRLVHQPVTVVQILLELCVKFEPPQSRLGKCHEVRPDRTQRFELGDSPDTRRWVLARPRTVVAAWKVPAVPAIQTQQRVVAAASHHNCRVTWHEPAHGVLNTANQDLVLGYR